MSSFYFRESGQNIERIREAQEQLELYKERLGPPKQVVSLNTRLPEDFRLNERRNKESNSDVRVALTRQERADEKVRKATLGLDAQKEGTPVINGYKIINQTPRYFKIPSTPLREELGLQLAQATENKKRNAKQQEKE